METQTTAPVASTLMPESEMLFWRHQYRFEPYFVQGRGFDQYSTAYQLGWQAALGRPEVQSFEALETELSQRWPKSRGLSLLDWCQVKFAVQAAWDRARSPNRCTELLSLLATKKLKLAQDAGRRFRESSLNYLDDGHQGMHVEALQRFALVSKKLLAELDALSALTQSLPRRPVSGVPIIMERSYQVWRDSGLMPADTFKDVLQKLTQWLNATEALAQAGLTDPVRKQIKHHLLVLRGQQHSLQWLGYEFL